MSPVHFPEANTRFGPPADMEESQVMTIHAYVHEIVGGSCDGLNQVVTAWRPTDEELELLKQGKPLFISFLGGLPPHYPSADFHKATHPA